MKKEYNAPLIAYESFRMSANIAACELLGAQHADFACPVFDKEGGFTIFVENACDYIGSSDAGEVCYGVSLMDVTVLES